MAQQSQFDDSQQTGNTYHYGSPYQEHGGTPALSRSNSENIPSVSATPQISPGHDQITIELKSFCDLVSNTLHLTAKQQSDLRSLVSFFPMINRHDLQIRIFQQASIFQLANDVSAVRADYASLRPLIEDLRNRINAAFTLTKDQMEQILVLAKDFVFKPNRTKYMDIMHHELETHIKAKAQSLGMGDIFGEPAREKLLREAIKSKASSARAQLRARVVDSIDGPKKCPLDKAAVLLAEKLKQGGPGIKLKIEYILRTAMFRRFTYDEYIGPAGTGGAVFDEEVEILMPEDSLNAQGKRVKLTPTPGKVRKGDDFWSRFDTYLTSKIALYGKDLTSDAWNSYFNELVAKDINQWGALAGTSRAEPLPITLMQPTQVPAPSNMFSAPAIPQAAAELPTPDTYRYMYSNEASVGARREQSVPSDARQNRGFLSPL